jgi:Ger(x)C family germination protein
MKRMLGLLVAVTLMLTGCWDKVELDRRAFVLGVAIDTAPEDEGNSDVYMLTLETPAPKQEGGGGEETSRAGQSQAKPSTIFTGTGKTFFEIIRKMATQSNKALFFGQQHVLIIGEDLLRRCSLHKILDFWIRDSEVDRSIKVLVARGRAEDIFKTTPKNAKNVSLFVKGVLEERVKTSRFVETKYIKLLKEMAEDGNMLIGGIAAEGEDVLRVSESAVIKGCKLQGWLNEEETRAVQYVMGEVIGGEIAVLDPENEDSFVSVEIYGVKTQVKADIKSGLPSFFINIKIDCSIAELGDVYRKLDEKNVESIERAAADIIKKQIGDTVKKLQKEFKTDVLGFREKLEKYHHKEWKKLKETWDELYPEVPVSIEVVAKVRSMGRAF